MIMGRFLAGLWLCAMVVPAAYADLPPNLQPISAVTLATDVLVGVEELSGGTSGYQLVFEVDVSKVPRVSSSADDPYWWQYYRSFWDNNGQFIGAGAGTMVNSATPWGNGPSVNSSFFWTDWNDDGWNTVDNNGSPSSSASSFPAATHFSTRSIYSSRSKLSGDLRYAYLQHHFRKKWDGGSEQWSPGQSSLGPNYYVWGEPLSGVTFNFKIQLYDKVVYETDSSSYYGAEGWEYVMAGEVKPSGWAIVPMQPIDTGNPSQQLLWVFVKPKGASLNVRTNAGTCPIPDALGEYPVEGTTPCIVDPDLWLPVDETISTSVEGGCTDSSGATVSWLSQDTCKRLAIFTGPQTYSNLEDIKYYDAKLQQVAFGGGLLIPDYDKAGKMYLVTPDGNSAEINADAAAIYVEEYKYIFMNGSGTKLDGGKDAAHALAESEGVPVVMIYMAQGIMYPDDKNNNTKEREALKILLARTQNTNIALVGHSWSGHIVLNEAKTYQNVDIFLVNPAHRPYSSIRDDFETDIRYSMANVTIIAGTLDQVSHWGRGRFAILYCAWNCSLKMAVESNNRVSQRLVASGHGIEGAINAGGGEIIRTR